MASQYVGKASVDEYTVLKDRIIALKEELHAANKRVRELEPDVKQVIVAMHAEEGGSANSEVFPVLLFADKRMVIELKRRRRTPGLNVKVLVVTLNTYLATQTLTKNNVVDFVNYLKMERKNRRTETDVLQYRAAKLSELDVSVPETEPMEVDDPEVPIVAEVTGTGLGAVLL